MGESSDHEPPLYIKRKIRSLVLSREEYEDLKPRLENRPRLLIWESKKDREDN